MRPLEFYKPLSILEKYSKDREILHGYCIRCGNHEDLTGVKEESAEYIECDQCGRNTVFSAQKLIEQGKYYKDIA